MSGSTAPPPPCGPPGPDDAAAAAHAEDAAWSGYLDHVRGCAECHRRLHNCPIGRALWRTYQSTQSAQSTQSDQSTTPPTGGRAAARREPPA